MFVPLRHILTHKTYKRVSRAMWVVITIVGLGFIPALSPFPPAQLLSSSGILTGAGTLLDYSGSIAVTVLTAMICLGVSVAVFSKKSFR